ncbi:carbohydrate ABC transporter permease [Saccharopolyspora sp. NPDC000359]|uniref:carbohydrate ABC transporter permease n=1 Tax=Saccharopolyspora sp. NPDC000359 TaxID=3154251 RepID=UPI0033319554
MADVAVLRTGARNADLVRNRRNKRLHWIAVHSLGLALGVMFLLPLVFVLLTAVMSDEQALTANLWPQEWHWENFAEVFTKAPMLRFLLNSLLYSTLATAFMLISSIPVAYALAKLRWRGRGVSFVLVIAAMMLPPQVTAVPLYILWTRFELTGTLWPLIIPHLFGDAFSIFLLRQFFLTIPRSYVDAAKVDGCSEFTAMLRIVVPMARPGIAAAAMFCFLYTWNDFFGPLLYAGENQQSWTLSIGLASFRGMHSVEWNLTMAATVLVMLPVIVLFLLAQRAFVRGITFTGVKG